MNGQCGDLYTYQDSSAACSAACSAAAACSSACSLVLPVVLPVVLPGAAWCCLDVVLPLTIKYFTSHPNIRILSEQG
jgi:hypothetical protein